MWIYTPTRAPITHRAGTIPPRPLQPGDTVQWPSGDVQLIAAVSDAGLLQLQKTNGRVAIEFQPPIEGDFSGCIVEIPVPEGVTS